MLHNPELSEKVAITFNRLSIRNGRSVRRRKRTSRRWAVRDISFSAALGAKTLVFGLPTAGKSALRSAILKPRRRVPQLRVRVPIQELSFKDNPAWTPRQYADHYSSLVSGGGFLLVDDPYENAMPFLTRLARGMLVFAGVDGHECFHRFDSLLYLRNGRIVFHGTPREFFRWVKAVRPPELRYVLADYLIESEGVHPGCPELDE